ncbi:hypothetical protein VTO42DRAFT_4675 [Malbranchea cinnamomea]
MSQYVAELCELLIADNFGDLYSLIWSYLLHHGRQPLPRIAHSTHLTPRQVRYGLAVLIQQHLVFHFTSLDDGITYYEADWRNAYALVRSGKIIQLVEERLGPYAAKVVSAILYLGHVRISDLEKMHDLIGPITKDSGQLSETNGINGVHTDEGNAADEGADDAEYEEEQAEQEARDGFARTNGHHETAGSIVSQLHSTLRQLASYGYIMRVRDHHFHSPADNYQSAVRQAKASSSVQGLRGSKLDNALKEVAETLVKEWTDGTISGILPNSAPRGIKRRVGSSESSEPARKRVKLENDLAHYEDEDEDHVSDDDYVDDVAPMDPSLVIRVNYQKFDVSFRNRRLVELAEQHTTPVTSRIYDVLLARIEATIPCCRTEEERVPEGEEGAQYSKAIPLHTIASDVPPDLALGGVIAGVGENLVGGPDGRLTNGDAEDEDEHDEDEDEDEDQSSGQHGQSRIFQIEQHLSFLAQEPFLFTTRKMESGMITWTVEYRHLARKLRHLELERLIEARFGAVAVRVVRILLDKGRLDEKRLQEISLMASKDLRQILAQMEAAGFVDLQEVPRDAQRQPSRTLYLWFYDPDRVSTMVLEDIYKAMSRCLQRLKVERNKLKSLLEKAERTDVKANMERYLSAAEREALKEWQEKEALILGEVSRLDDMVAVLRDY